MPQLLILRQPHSTPVCRGDGQARDSWGKGGGRGKEGIHAPRLHACWRWLAGILVKWATQQQVWRAIAIEVSAAVQRSAQEAPVGHWQQQQGGRGAGGGQATASHAIVHLQAPLVVEQGGLITGVLAPGPPCRGSPQHQVCHAIPVEVQGAGTGAQAGEDTAASGAVLGEDGLHWHCC